VFHRLALLLILAFSAPHTAMAAATAPPSGQVEALALFRLHYDQDALQATEAILSTKPDASWVRRLQWMRGVLLQRLDRPQEAAAVLAPLATDSTPLSGLAAMHLEECLRLAGDTEGALAMLDQLSSPKRGNPHVPSKWRTIETARSLTAHGWKKKASQAWKRVLKLRGRGVPFAEAHAQLFRLNTDLGNTAKARYHQRSLLIRYPASPEAVGVPEALLGSLSQTDHVVRAEALWEARAYLPAIAQYERLLKYPAHRHEAHLRIGRLYSERLREEYDLAITHLRGASKASNSKVAGSGLYKLGLALGKVRRYDEAVKTLRTFRRRFKGHKSYREAGFEIGRHLMEAGHFRKAGDHILHWVGDSKGIKDKPKYSWFAAWAYLRGGHPAEAMPILKKLARSGRTLIGDKASYWMGMAQDMMGSRADAIRTLRRTTERFPFSYYAWLATRRLEGWGEATPASPQLSPPSSPVSAWRLAANADLSPALVGRLRDLRDLVEIGELVRAREHWESMESSLKRQWKGKGFERFEAALQRPLEKFYTERKKAWRAHRAVRTKRPSEKNAYGWRALYPRAFESMARIAAEREGVPEWLVYAHMLQESRYSPEMISGAKAFGVLQILRSTAKRIAEDNQLPYEDAWLFDPGYNIRLAAWYLGALARRFQGQLPLAIASYNGGPRLLSFHLHQYPGLDLESTLESLPAHQSRNYARKVMEHLHRYLAIYTSPQTLRSVMERLITDRVEARQLNEPSY